MSWWLIPVLLIYFIVCMLLMGIILIQSGKGGGLSSLGSAAGGISDALGATGAEKTLNKITTGIAVGFMVLAIILSIGGSVRKGSNAGEEIFGNQPVVPTATTGAAGTATIPAQPPAESGATATVNTLDQIQLPPATGEQPPAQPPTESAPPAESAAPSAPPVGEPAPPANP